MKKPLLIIFILFNVSLWSQAFPFPYCDIAGFEEIEEITQVTLNSVTISNTTTTLPLIDKTNFVVDVTRGQQYTITVKGNTAGPYDNKYYMYVDWNNNTVLNDSGEEYYIGQISNSTGYDSMEASFPFTVPANAPLGETRVRINKGYNYEDDDFWEYELMISDPCAMRLSLEYYFEDFFEEVENYGQMLDFTLNVVDSSMDVPSAPEVTSTALRVYPNPVQDLLQIDYKDGIANATIFDLNGRKVASYDTVSAAGLPVSSLSSGLYLLKIVTTSNETKMVKFNRL